MEQLLCDALPWPITLLQKGRRKGGIGLNMLPLVQCSRVGKVDEAGLPLVYDKELIQKYWDSQVCMWWCPCVGRNHGGTASSHDDDVETRHIMA